MRVKSCKSIKSCKSYFSGIVLFCREGFAAGVSCWESTPEKKGVLCRRRMTRRPGEQWEGKCVLNAARVPKAARFTTLLFICFGRRSSELAFPTLRRSIANFTATSNSYMSRKFKSKKFSSKSYWGRISSSNNF